MSFITFNLFFKNGAYFYSSVPSEFGGNSTKVGFKVCSLGSIVSVSWKLVMNADFQIIHPSARVDFCLNQKAGHKKSADHSSAHQRWKAWATKISSDLDLLSVAAKGLQ